MMINILNRIGGVMGSVFASGLYKNYAIGICCFSAKHVALWNKGKGWLAGNQNNVSEWSDMFTRELLFQWASTLKVQLSVLVYNKTDIIIISLNINLFLPWYRWKTTELALSNNYALTKHIWLQSLRKMTKISEIR